MKIIEIVRLSRIVDGFVIQGLPKEKVIEFLDWNDSLKQLISSVDGQLRFAQEGLEFDKEGNALDKEKFEKAKQEIAEIGEREHEVEPLFTIDELLQLTPQGIYAQDLGFAKRHLVK